MNIWRRVIPAVLAMTAAVTAVAQEYRCDSIDFEAVVREVEENYAGYPTKVTGENVGQYGELKERLRRAIREQGRRGYDAAGELLGWFGDFHLRTGLDEARAYMRPAADYSSMEYAPANVSCRVDEQTWLIRVESFEAESGQIAWVEHAVECYRASGCEYLVVDIRGNGGGRDTTYQPLLRLLYDRPGCTDGVEVRVTPKHEACLRGLVGADPEGMAWLGPVIDSMATGRYGFVPLPGADEPIEYDEVSPLPRRAAVIVDGNVASSGEQFVLDVRACSDRTRIYGRDNTLGCLDYSNILPFNLPCSGVTCWVPMTRSMRVGRGRGVDREGIAPDVRIPLPLPAVLTDGVDEWVRYVAAELKRD